jgi:hypothetical protein
MVGYKLQTSIYLNFWLLGQIYSSFVGTVRPPYSASLGFKCSITSLFHVFLKKRISTSLLKSHYHISTTL